MEVRLDVRAAHHVDAAWIYNDEFRTFTQTLLHARGKDGVTVGWVGANDHDHIGLIDALEVLRTGRLTERRLQAIARRRVADAGARVDVIVSECGAHHALDNVDFLIRRARRRNAAD